MILSSIAVKLCLYTISTVYEMQLTYVHSTTKMSSLVAMVIVVTAPEKPMVNIARMAAFAP